MMNLAEYASYDALGLAELVASKQVPPKELAQTAAAAIASINPAVNARSEEHTSELQSQSNLVCRPLLEEKGRLNVDGMNIIRNDGSHKLNRSRKARVSYKVQRTINASLNAATSTRAVSSNPNFVTRQKIEIIFG